METHTAIGVDPAALRSRFLAGIGQLALHPPGSQASISQAGRDHARLLFGRGRGVLLFR